MPRYYVPAEELRPISIEEIDAYISLAKDTDLKVMIATAWLTGNRITELVNLRKDQVIIDEKERDISFNIMARKKGGRSQPSFSFSDPFVESIVLPYFREMRVGYGEEKSRIFRRGKRSYQLMLLDLNRKIFGDDTKMYIVFHHLRHSRITYLAQILRATQEEIRAWTGHKTGKWMDYIAARKVDRFKGKIR